MFLGTSHPFALLGTGTATRMPTGRGVVFADGIAGVPVPQAA